MKFKKWCEDNQSIFVFVGALSTIVIPVLIELFTGHTINFKDGFTSFLNIFSLRINIPIYSILLFGFVLSFFIYKYFSSKSSDNPYFSNFPIQKKKNKEMVIQSDDNTMFLGSPTYKDLTGNVKSIEYTNPIWIQNSIKFPIFDGAKWISHSNNITDIEAINGGIYKFKKEFYIENKFKLPTNAFLYLLVDDFCTVFMNGNILVSDNGQSKVEGFVEVKRFDILKHLLIGKNEIIFHIENRNFLKMNVPGKQFYKAQDKGQRNPYGIIFTIKIDNEV